MAHLGDSTTGIMAIHRVGQQVFDEIEVSGVVEVVLVPMEHGPGFR